MGMVCKICRYDELTRDELYDIIQMRIEGFIVRNKCIYQDMETYYDQCGMYVMIWENGVMTNSWQMCDRKIFVGKDGKEYRYPAWRRQVVKEGYKAPGYPLAVDLTRKACELLTGLPYFMCEVFDKKMSDDMMKVAGSGRYINEYYDDAERYNYVCVVDNEITSK